jgi:hypothetical protein
METTNVFKQLLKSKVMANFSHYCSGNLYYTVQLEEGLFQFPIETTEFGCDYISPDDIGERVTPVRVLKLSSDLGTTPFDAQIKGSFLNRWITKAIKNEEFIKLN